MTARKEHEPPKRDPRGRWLKGQSANPGGRRADPLSHALRERIDQETATKLIDVMIARLLAGDTKLASLVWDRLEGKLPQPLAVQSDGELRLTYVNDWRATEEPD